MFSQKKILIVDDESFNIMAIKAMMKQLRFANHKTHVDIAYSGEDALELFKRSICQVKRRSSYHHVSSEYSLILMDCSMPFMDGYECSRLISQVLEQNGISDEHDKPKIIAVTGHIESEYLRRALLSGMSNIYSKLDIAADTR